MSFQPRKSHPNDDITKWPTKLEFRDVILLSRPLACPPATACCSQPPPLHPLPPQITASWGDWQAVGTHKACWPHWTQNAMAVAGVLDMPTPPLSCYNIRGAMSPIERTYNFRSLEQDLMLLEWQSSHNTSRILCVRGQMLCQGSTSWQTLGTVSVPWLPSSATLGMCLFYNSVSMLGNKMSNIYFRGQL